MAITNASDISVVLSGGTVNINPNKSLGGDPSSSPITSSVLNNLFSDVGSDQSSAGLEDYRCIYFFNDGSTAIYSVEIWIKQNFNTGNGTIELGIFDQNETQRIIVNGAVTGGSFTLSYKTSEFTVDHNSDLSIWALNLQNAINDLIYNDELAFHSASVVASNTPSSVIFDIKFSGLDAKRNFEKFTLISNDLISGSSTTILISAPLEGSPINTIASEINADTTPPGSVGFSSPSAQSPIRLPYLGPGDGFPLWVRRTVPAGTIAQENDGFIMAFKSSSLPI